MRGAGRLRRAIEAGRARRFARRLALPKLLRAFADTHPRAFFIEIGSNDGQQHDHLRPFILSHDWTGIMVEPVPYVFERLRRNYAGVAGVTLENVAIADRDGELPFWRLSDAAPEERERLPSWYDGIGSLSREAVLSHARHIPDIEQRLVGEPLPCLTFESLCRKHDVERLDLLLIDTEGYDWDMIRGIDLERRHPRLLVYEHYHLSAEERAACRAHVERHGYETMEEGFDTACLDTTLDDELTRAWHGLRPGIAGQAAYEEAP